MPNNKPKYLDAASTTPVDPRVKEAMLPYFDEIFGNASSQHIYGKQAKRAIDKARGQVAEIINADQKEIYFTSGATESINWALKGYMEANPEKGNHIITVKTEHKAVLNTCEYLENKGYEVTYLDVDANGLISLNELKNAIQNKTAIISVMYVNNEIGIIQNIQEIGKIARDNSICFFTDATQAVGKIEVDVVKDNIDMLCLSAHKLKGPKGIGSLYIRTGVKLEPLIHGGGQENGMRGGTYNTPLIVGLGKACEIAQSEYKSNLEKYTLLKDVWEERLSADAQLLFKNSNVAPHIMCFRSKNCESEEFLMLKAKEFAASTGSACNSNIVEKSHVTAALRPDYELFRISFNLNEV